MQTHHPPPLIRQHRVQRHSSLLPSYLHTLIFFLALTLALTFTLTTHTHAQSSIVCSNITTCLGCATQVSCGYCIPTRSCHYGNTSGPLDGTTCAGFAEEGWNWSEEKVEKQQQQQQRWSRQPIVPSSSSSSSPHSTTNSAWAWNTGMCPSLSCTSYTTCDTCSNTDPELNCGWCEDTHACTVGTTKGPLYGECSSQGWSWESCGSASICAAQQDCASCLSLSTTSQCGWCDASSSCSLGNDAGPYLGASHCAYHWKFDSDFSGSTLQCYAPMPYSHLKTSESTIDWSSFSSLIVCALLLSLLTLCFNPCCGYRGWIPQPGTHGMYKRRVPTEINESRGPDEHLHAGVDGGYDDDDDDDALARVKERRCCTSFNTRLYKLFLWLYTLGLLTLLVLSLSFDHWSHSVYTHPELHPIDNPLTTIEGLLQTYISLGVDHHSPSTYTYDCSTPNSKDVSQIECYVHMYSGYFTLICGLLSAVFACFIALMSSSDFLCTPTYTSENYYNAAHQLKIRFPFTQGQWRLSIFSAICSFGGCCIYISGNYLLSQQYFHSTLYLWTSFYLMLSACCAAVVLSFLYQHAIRVTPEQGYPLDGRNKKVQPPGVVSPLNSALGYPHQGQKPREAVIQHGEYAPSGIRRQVSSTSSTSGSGNGASSPYPTFQSQQSYHALNASSRSGMNTPTPGGRMNSPRPFYQGNASSSVSPSRSASPAMNSSYHAMSSSPSSSVSSAIGAIPPPLSLTTSLSQQGQHHSHGSTSPVNGPTESSSYTPPPGYVLVPASQVPPHVVGSATSSSTGSPRSAHSPRRNSFRAVHAATLLRQDSWERSV